jgi:hypothetical protein
MFFPSRLYAFGKMVRPAHALFLAILLGCGSDTTTPAALPILSGGIRISPGVVEVKPGETQALQVQVSDASGNVIATPVVDWTTSDAGVATVTSSGMVAGVSVGFAWIVARSGGASDTAEVRVIPDTPVGAVIDVYPEVLYQEMTGWEGTAQVGEVECNASAFSASRSELITRLVNELGINRVRLETRSGHENPQDYYTAYKNTRQPSVWNPHRYEAINDNDDPRLARAGGFQFAELDHKADVIIQPMRALLQARGERLYVNLNYVDFGTSAFEHSSDPEEYAELILQAFLHLKDRYGWVPDAVEIILEPDNTANWKPDVIGRAIVATGDRLRAAGFRPAFIAPSNTSMSSALSYLDGVLAVPRVLEYLTDVAYHRYSNVSSATVAAIAARANQFGLRTAMLEHIGSPYQDLHEDLRLGQNSSWQQFVLAWCATSDNGGHYYRFDQTVQTSSSVTLGGRSRYFRQYFPFIRLNARRIGAASGDSRLDPLAFRNANGRVVVVIKAAEGASMQLRRLPPGSYGVTFTTASQSFVSLGDMNVSASGTLQVSIPAAGVITIHQR